MAEGSSATSNMAGGDAEVGSVSVESTVSTLKFSVVAASGGGYLTGTLSVASVWWSPTAFIVITIAYLAWYLGTTSGAF